jgi:predicted Zn-dependent peptidase
VFTSNWAGISPGAFLAEAQCQPEKADEVKTIILKNLNKAATYTPTQEEINLAVNTILTAELLDDQSINGLAMGGALDELWGFGYDHRTKLEGLYRSVKPEDVARVAKKYLGKGYVIFVGKAEGK